MNAGIVQKIKKFAFKLYRVLLVSTDMPAVRRYPGACVRHAFFKHLELRQVSADVEFVMYQKNLAVRQMFCLLYRLVAGIIYAGDFADQPDYQI